MRKKYVLIPLVVALLIVMAFPVLANRPPKPAVTGERYDIFWEKLITQSTGSVNGALTTYLIGRILTKNCLQS